jgi:hypothetical protein
MGIFESIKNAIFGHGSSPAPATAAPAAATAPAAGAATASVPTPAAATVAAPAMSQADLTAQLTQMSGKNAQKLNWQTSIVDLMKLVGLDPSLANRKQLAQELGYTGDTADSAAMNVWLHKEVMEKLAAGGGKVTSDLK